MATITITITDGTEDDDEDRIHVSFDFDPPIKTEDDLTASQGAALRIMQFMKEEAQGGEFDDFVAFGPDEVNQ